MGKEFLTAATTISATFVFFDVKCWFKLYIYIYIYICMDVWLSLERRKGGHVKLLLVISQTSKSWLEITSSLRQVRGGYLYKAVVNLWFLHEFMSGSCITSCSSGFCWECMTAWHFDCFEIAIVWVCASIHQQLLCHEGFKEEIIINPPTWLSQESWYFTVWFWWKLAIYFSCLFCVGRWNSFVSIFLDQAFRYATRLEVVQVLAWEHFWFQRSERNILTGWCLHSLFSLHQRSQTRLWSHIMPPSQCISW